MTDELSELEPLDDPFEWFDTWFERARDTELKYPNAMTLATVSASDRPRARTVLLKSWDRDGFVFYTNYRSAKGEDLGANSHAALTAYWRPMDRQIRIEGGAERLEPEASDDYFATRDRTSQIGAWASQQSEPLESRDALMEEVRKYEEQFEGDEVPRPPHWGGFRVVPSRMVFWRAGAHRLHDRWEFRRTDRDEWTRTRLNP